MLFNSPEFLFLFFPVTFLLFHIARRYLASRVALAWLTAASLFFYGWWDPRYLALLLGSVAVNYATGRALAAAGPGRRPLLFAGIAFNLGLLGWFKYAGFFDRLVEAVSGLDLGWAQQALPLAISFFTFQQIAYLVDISRGQPPAESFWRFLLFITFFPHLIAGPIVHPSIVLPQFARLATSEHAADGQWQQRFAIGAFLFSIGLFKKVVVADGIAAWADAVFNAAALGQALHVGAAWIGALAYTLQLYFDFSGYSDMALGLALFFGIRLPINFDSPYQATSPVDFWRRWHMTLSRFLRDYLYIPLGGNRKGPARRHVNLLLTMTLGGLWHGAGWTFVLWGFYHGLLLAAAHAWGGRRRSAGGAQSALRRTAAILGTFILVLLGWVLFRSADIGTAGRIYAAMAGLPAAEVATDVLSGQLGKAFQVLLPLTVATLCLPNAYCIVGWLRPAVAGTLIARRLAFAATARWATATALILTVALMHLTRVSKFLYFDF